jgi:asparagine synthase (glutamine-hydrolysing)
MRSDVPLGAFLSGGIDSSTVVALMQTQKARPVKTFTIGIEDSNYDEAPEAALVAKCLGTDHTELYVTPAEALAVIPELPSMYDEPFADSSQIPTHLVARLARQQVTVCLSGDGGDELFGGYNRHLWGPRLARAPLTLRKWTGRALTSVSVHGWDKLFEYVKPVLPTSMRPRMPGHKLHKLATLLPCSDIESLYRRLTSHWIDPATVLGVQQIPLPTTKGIGLEAAEHMMLLDTLTYLPDDILAKLDRATMAVGLEARTPFLDPRVYEFAWRLPPRMKIRQGKGKWILRQVLQKYVPQRFVNRPKAGFGIPLDCWLAGPLRDWCESLLCESRLRQDGILDPSPIRERWAAYLAGETYWTWHLWDVLMFQAWMDANRSRRQQPQPELVSPLP